MSQRPMTCPGCLYSGQPHFENCPNGSGLASPRAAAAAGQQCEKCGGTDVFTRWHAGHIEACYSWHNDGCCSSGGDSRTDKKGLDPGKEHLMRYCRGCGYRWLAGASPAALAAPPHAHPWTERECEVIAELAKKLDVSEFVIIRQGLRTYQLLVDGNHKLVNSELPPLAAPPQTPKVGDVVLVRGHAIVKMDDMFLVHIVTGKEDAGGSHQLSGWFKSEQLSPSGDNSAKSPNDDTLKMTGVAIERALENTREIREELLKSEQIPAGLMEMRLDASKITEEELHSPQAGSERDLGYFPPAAATGEEPRRLKTGDRVLIEGVITGCVQNPASYHVEIQNEQRREFGDWVDRKLVHPHAAAAPLAAPRDPEDICVRCGHSLHWHSPVVCGVKDCDCSEFVFASENLEERRIAAQKMIDGDSTGEFSYNCPTHGLDASCQCKQSGYRRQFDKAMRRIRETSATPAPAPSGEPQHDEVLILAQDLVDHLLSLNQEQPGGIPWSVARKTGELKRALAARAATPAPVKYPCGTEASPGSPIICPIHGNACSLVAALNDPRNREESTKLAREIAAAAAPATPEVKP